MMRRWNTSIKSDCPPEGRYLEMWNEYVTWRRNVEPTLPDEDRLFHTRMNGKTVWVIEDGQAFSLLFPEDY